ncbi:hypothetical protein O626_02755, partial [Staphylococcus aureus M0592]
VNSKLDEIKDKITSWLDKDNNKNE